MLPIPSRPLATYIDHTLLRPEAPRAAYEALAAEAAAHGFAAICVPPVWLGPVAALLAGTSVRPCTVIAFPFGYVHPAARREESSRAIEGGAVELDTVIDVSLLKGGEGDRAQDDLSAWVEAARRERADLTLKVILETALLSDDEKVRAAEIAVAAGADFVKTSTGFGPGGATVEDVALLFRTVASRARVKASGGIRDLDTALAMIAAGADRIGTSSGVCLLAAAREREA